MPNNSNNVRSAIFYSLKFNNFFVYANNGFSKIANSTYICIYEIVLCIRIVWRQSEFAFCMRRLRLAHFLFLRRVLWFINILTKEYIKLNYCNIFIFYFSSYSHYNWFIVFAPWFFYKSTYLHFRTEYNG